MIAVTKISGAGRTDEGRRAPERSGRGDLIGTVAVFALNAVAIVVLLRLWNTDMRVPFNYSGDGLLNLAIVRNVIDNGWFLTNPDLGAPFGQHLTDYGALSSDNLSFALIKVLALFTSSPGLIINLVYVLSFPIVAVVAFLVLRRLGVGPLVAALCGTLYTLVPYHFLRGEGHLFLGFSYSVPLGILLVLELLAGRPLFARRARGGPRLLAWASRRTLATLAICAVVASGGVYYAIFTLLLLTAAMLVGAITRQGREQLITGGVLLAAIVAVSIFNLAPSIVYDLQHGANPHVGLRQPSESERYSFKLIELVMPVPGHRIDALDRFQATYHRTAPVASERMQSLGLVGTIGLIWLALVALAATVGRSLPRHAGAAFADRERHAAFTVAVAVLIGTTGGVSSFIAYALSPQIRAWGRISIFIAFLALFAVALLLERLRGRLDGSRRGGAIVIAVVGAIALVGVLDQTNHTFVPAYATVKREFSNDAALAATIDRRMAPGAAIMQLPYVPFPENHRIGAMADYELLRPYVHGGALHWSYGVVKGRDDDWQAAFFGLTPALAARGVVAPRETGRSAREDLAAIVAAGFDGLYIDRFGYGGLAAPPIEQAIRRVIGDAPLVGANGRMAFYDLTTYAAGLRRRLGAARLAALGTATLHPLATTFGAGFHPPETLGARSWRWTARSATLTIDNPSDTARTVRLRATLDAAGQAATATFSLPDGSVLRRATATRPTSLPIPLRPGRNTVRIVTEGERVPGNPNDTRELFLRLINPTIADP